MKALVKLILSIICIILYMQVLAQISPHEVNSQRDVKTKSSTTYSETSANQGNDSGAGIYATRENFGEECSMYLNDWTKATIVLKDKTLLTDKLVRYNIYNQEMQFISDGDTVAFGNPVEIESVNIDGSVFIYRDFLSHDEIKDGYFEVLVEGGCQLLLHRCIAYRYIEESTDPNSNFVKEQYYLSKKYFISENGKTATMLPNKKKEIIAMLEDNEKDIKSYIKQNKIKLCNEEDLKDLISYYNSD